MLQLLDGQIERAVLVVNTPISAWLPAQHRQHRPWQLRRCLGPRLRGTPIQCSGGLRLAHPGSTEASHGVVELEAAVLIADARPAGASFCARPTR